MICQNGFNGIFGVAPYDNKFIKKGTKNARLIQCQNAPDAGLGICPAVPTQAYVWTPSPLVMELSHHGRRTFGIYANFSKPLTTPRGITLDRGLLFLGESAENNKIFNQGKGTVQVNTKAAIGHLKASDNKLWSFIPSSIQINGKKVDWSSDNCRGAGNCFLDTGSPHMMLPQSLCDEFTSYGANPPPVSVCFGDNDDNNGCITIRPEVYMKNNQGDPCYGGETVTLGLPIFMDYYVVFDDSSTGGISTAFMKFVNIGS